MSTESNRESTQSCSTIGWMDSLPGVLAGGGAGLCCAGPLLFGALGMSGIAGTLASMPFVYHVILQWFALGLIVGGWGWFFYKLNQLPDKQRWNRISIVTGLILLVTSAYVLRSWATHVLI